MREVELTTGTSVRRISNLALQKVSLTFLRHFKEAS